MKELTLNGKKFLATKRAAEITGYTTDYVGQLARQGKVEAQLVGRNWYIGEDSITKHKFGEAQVSIRKEEEERHSPQLEVLVSSAADTLEDVEEAPVEKVSINKEVEQNSGAEMLTEMQDAWQDWYKAQRSVPTEEQEVFLSREDEKEERDSAEVVVPITRSVVEVEEEPVVEDEEIEEVVQEAPVELTPSPLPVQRSWAGTGLALAGVLAIVFVGALTVTAGYVLTKNTDSPVAAVYQGVEDYVLGVQRFEKK
jgi:uncharacterized protein (DUF2267 family)